MTNSFTTIWSKQYDIGKLVRYSFELSSDESYLYFMIADISVSNTYILAVQAANGVLHDSYIHSNSVADVEMSTMAISSTNKVYYTVTSKSVTTCYLANLLIGITEGTSI